MDNIRDLSVEIFKYSLFPSEKIKSDYLTEIPEKEKQEKAFYITCEFIYLFLHLTSRELFNFDSIKRSELIEELTLLTVTSAIKTFFDNLPKDIEDDMITEFYKNLQMAELEYSSCKEFLTKDQPFSDTAIFSRFGKTISKLADKPDNVEIIMVSMELALHSWVEKIKEQVNKLKV